MWRTALTLDAVCEVEEPTRIGVVDGGPALRHLLPQVAARLDIGLLPGTDIGRPAARGRAASTGVKSRLLTWAAEARRALPAPRPALATGGTLAFVHSAFWRDATGEEGYIAPVLDALAGDARGADSAGRGRSAAQFPGAALVASADAGLAPAARRRRGDSGRSAHLASGHGRLTRGLAGAPRRRGRAARQPRAAGGARASAATTCGI